MRMDALLEVYPGAQRALFRQYHIGGCSSCGFRPEETLTQVCARNENLPVEDVIAFLQSSQLEDERMFISPVELAGEMERGVVQLLDIRTREEFEAVKIDSSRLFSQELLAEISTQWAKDKLLVLIDHQGKRVLDAAAYFAGHGFTQVRGLAGGIDAWSVEVNADLPRYHLE